MSFSAFVVKRSGDPFCRVAVGVYGDADSAARAKDQLERQGFKSQVHRPLKLIKAIEKDPGWIRVALYLPIFREKISERILVLHRQDRDHRRSMAGYVRERTTKEGVQGSPWRDGFVPLR